jgi:hypothetical protein
MNIACQVRIQVSLSLRIEGARGKESEHVDIRTRRRLISLRKNEYVYRFPETPNSYSFQLLGTCGTGALSPCLFYPGLIDPGYAHLGVRSLEFCFS